MDPLSQAASTDRCSTCGSSPRVVLILALPWVKTKSTLRWAIFISSCAASKVGQTVQRTKHKVQYWSIPVCMHLSWAVLCVRVHECARCLCFRSDAGNDFSGNPCQFRSDRCLGGGGGGGWALMSRWCGETRGEGLRCWGFRWRRRKKEGKKMEGKSLCWEEPHAPTHWEESLQQQGRGTAPRQRNNAEMASEVLMTWECFAGREGVYY